MIRFYEHVKDVLLNDGKVLNALPSRLIGAKTEQETIEIKPVLSPDVAQTVFDIIKDFFSTEQQPQLKQILETGNNSDTKLLFKGNGNRLTDTFKKLIEHDFIIGCRKKDLTEWVIANFQYLRRSDVKNYTLDTVNKIVSRNGTPCKNPLIEIKTGEISRNTQ